MWISRFKVGKDINNNLMVSHLLCTDDTILFYDSNVDQLLHFKMVLICFEVVISLTVNLNKIEIVLVGEVSNIDEMANICWRFAKELFRYASGLSKDSVESHIRLNGT